MRRLRLDWEAGVERIVVGFHQDERADWVADLECGHRRHMRHKPPWMVREWVLTEEGRGGFVGHKLDCGQCDEARSEAQRLASPARPEASNKG
jgi:hypothetical protein